MRVRRTLAERLFAAGLRLLPPAIRRADGDEMLDAFTCLWRERRGPAARLALAATLFGRLPLAVAVEWWDLWRAAKGRSPRGVRMDPIRQDLAQALRAVRSDLGLFFFATAVIGLGVGAATAVFSVMSPLMLRPLPFEDPGRLVWIANEHPESGLSGVTSRTGNLRDFREWSRSLEGLTGYNAFSVNASENLTGDGEPERVAVVEVAHDFLDVLGVRPAIGRNFVPEEGLDEGRSAVLLAHGFWSRRYGADPEVVGRVTILDGRPHVVVGVLPPSFGFAGVFAPRSRVDLLRPFPITSRTDRWGNTLSMIGRLRPGVSVASAQAELDGIVDALQEADPDRWGLGAVVSPLREHVAGPFRSAFLLLAAAAGGVVLIVSVNLSNLLLARSPRRVREMAIRNALGAGRGRLIRQLVLESLVLSTCGAIVGVGVAALAIRLVTGSSGIGIPLLSTASIDGAALFFSVAVAAVTGLLVGVLPAFVVTRRGGLAAATPGRGVGGGRRGRRLREALVMSEIALACVLLVTGGLLLKSFQRVLDVDLGFRPEGAISWQITPTRGFDSLEEKNAYFEQLAQRVAAVPGVEAVGLSDSLPLVRNRSWSMRAASVERRADDQKQAFPHLVDHRYIGAMGIPVIAGRSLGPDDTGETERVVVINQTAAAAMFDDPAPIDRMLVAGPEWRVVGVVADVRHQSPEQQAGSEVYFPFTQHGDFGTMALVVRSRLAADVLAPSVGAAIRAFDPALPSREYQTLGAIVDLSLSPRRFTVSVLGTFAAAALLLAAVGIYGVLSYAVTEQAPEISIRMALGESAAAVCQRVVGRTLILALLGVALGLALSLLATRWIGSLLYDVEPTDTMTFAVMTATLLAVAVLAGALPARRASRTDPTRLLAES
ncbi:MAG TPA: ADOP family duplicated permease [Thermoanaerobaculia bacterium]|nr:ADOP family duplicated permease [Thermoanaerobaculia bacterium]